jgi:hypothetical protein
MLWNFNRDPEPDPETGEEDVTPPSLGVHPLYDLYAMTFWQARLNRHLARVLDGLIDRHNRLVRRVLWLTIWYAILALVWVFVAVNDLRLEIAHWH